MLLVGSLVVLCGLLAQSSAQLAYPLPLSYDLPTSVGHCRPLHLDQNLPTSVGHCRPLHLDQNLPTSVGHCRPLHLDQNLPTSVGHCRPLHLDQNLPTSVGHCRPLHLDQNLPTSVGHCRPCTWTRTCPHLWVTAALAPGPEPAHICGSLPALAPGPEPAHICGSLPALAPGPEPAHIHGSLPPMHLSPSPSYTVTPVVTTYPTHLIAANFRNAFSQGLLSGGILGFLEHMPLLSYVRPAGSNAGGLVGVIGRVIYSIPILNNILDIKVTNPQLLELGLVQSYDFHRLYVTIPLGFELKVNTPLIGRLLEFAVKLDLTAEIYAVRDIQGRSRLVIGDCINSPGSLRITLPKGLNLLQNLIDSLTDILTKVIPGLVQGVVCPVVNGILSLLDVTLMHDVAELLLHGVQFVIKA